MQTGEILNDMDGKSESQLLERLEALNRMLDDDPKAHRTLSPKSTHVVTTPTSDSVPSRVSSPFEPLPMYKDEDDQLLDLMGMVEPTDDEVTNKESSAELIKWKSLLNRCRTLEEESCNFNLGASSSSGSSNLSGGNSTGSSPSNSSSAFKGTSKNHHQPHNIGYTRVLGEGIWKKTDRAFLERQILKKGGFPNGYRGQLWNLLAQSHLYAHYLEPRYFELIENVSPYEKMIRRDLGRTFPTLEFFKSRGGQDSLHRVLSSYSQYDKVVGYCQGISFIAGLFLLNASDPFIITFKGFF